MYNCSVITSIYNSEKFIRGFLDNCLEQEGLENFEFLLLDTASEDNTQEIILSYDLPENFFYKRYDQKYSIYETWNRGVDLASSDILTNWNTDDRKRINGLKIHSDYMQANPECDLSYGYVAWSYKPNEKFEEGNLQNLYPCEAPSSRFLVGHNSPHNMPFWRKDLHDKHGYFDTVWRTAADHEFWLRCHHAGAQFEKINQVMGLYYYNPEGLSTNQQSTNIEEGKKIREIYNEKGY